VVENGRLSRYFRPVFRRIGIIPLCCERLDRSDRQAWDDLHHAILCLEAVRWAWRAVIKIIFLKIPNLKIPDSSSFPVDMGAGHSLR
jgi:hypothetical protein